MGDKVHVHVHAHAEGDQDYLQCVYMYSVHEHHIHAYIHMYMYRVQMHTCAVNVQVLEGKSYIPDPLKCRAPQDPSALFSYSVLPEQPGTVSEKENEEEGGREGGEWEVGRK